MPSMAMPCATAVPMTVSISPSTIIVFVIPLLIAVILAGRLIIRCGFVAAVVFIAIIIVSQKRRALMHSYKMSPAPVMMIAITGRQAAGIHPLALFRIHINLPVYIVIHAIVGQIIIIGYFIVNRLAVNGRTQIDVDVDLGHSGSTEAEQQGNQGKLFDTFHG